MLEIALQNDGEKHIQSFQGIGLFDSCVSEILGHKCASQSKTKSYKVKQPWYFF